MLALPFGRQHAPTVGETAPTSREVSLQRWWGLRRDATLGRCCSKDNVWDSRAHSRRNHARDWLAGAARGSILRGDAIREEQEPEVSSCRRQRRSTSPRSACCSCSRRGVGVAERPPALESHDEVDLDDSTDDPVGRRIDDVLTTAQTFDDVAGFGLGISAL